ncbi:hypothetical protein RhiirA5_465686 [Rhizophagus irregularis]|uniref:WW domain-containing protein n=1 Tax=Rhizophagus irregularis TaxID=588596 RepID=A0A2N0RVH3_9GLOM|nr:hypothetical protein RhiirA5_465686 [Rhizophagus irregularis]PKC67305.1 hypothetical protein RhiirA1_509993 [Rhizophagus irregularis]CAB4482255.1 unnamed protein product [Rhizophagus irregularis]CAB4482257.1 unnamed protein product [Rhizophagus irregularis]CAB5184458.1 unnamed protein product [Rhizophagus irregularis]
MDPRPLPPGFISQYDQNTQRYYYVDTSTGVSQWNHPLDAKPYSPPPVGQTSSQYPMQLPTPSANPNPQGHYPLGFTDPNSSATYGGGSQIPQSKEYATIPYVMQQQSSSPYPQPTPSNYPSSYLQSGPYGSGGKPTETYPYSSQSDYRVGHNPHGEAQSYVSAPSHTQGPPGSKVSKKKEDKGMGGMGGAGDIGKLLLGTGMGAAGGLLVGNMAKKKFKKHKHKGWKGKWKGWKGKGWKGKGWKGKGWKGWK